MNMMNILFRKSLLAAIALLLIGNNLAPSGDAVLRVAQTERAHPSHHGHEELRSIGKPGTNIAQLQQSIFHLAPTSTPEVELQITSPLNNGTLWVQVSSNDAVAGAVLESDWEMDLSKTNELSLPLQLNTSAPGRYQVSIIAHHLVEGRIQHSRALAAELRIGAGDTALAMHEKSAVKQYPDYIAMPAQEVIR